MGLQLIGGSGGGAGSSASTADLLRAPTQEFIVSTGTMPSTEGTFGLAIAYTQANRLSAVVKNLSAVNIQVGYAARGGISPPSNWATTQTIVPGGDWLGDPNRGDPIWVRDPAGASPGPVVSYRLTLGV